jgi:hypothetical protein
MALVCRHTVTAVYPWEAFEPAEDVHRRGHGHGPCVVYLVDGRLPKPVVGIMAKPQSLGWIEIGRIDGQEERSALEPKSSQQHHSSRIAITPHAAITSEAG